MRHMRMHEALLAYGGKNLFCLSHGVTKQIFIRGFWHFCLILPHKPHEFRIVKMVITKNMRIMRMYEEGIFKGFCLPCIEIGKGGERRTQKYEAVMREYEDDPHIFRRRLA